MHNSKSFILASALIFSPGFQSQNPNEFISNNPVISSFTESENFPLNNLVIEGNLNLNSEEISKNIFITIDDCNNLTHLSSMLNILEENNLKATFFPNTDYIDINNPEVVELWRSIYNNGHTIGYHTTNHLNNWDTDSNNDTAINRIHDDFLEFTEFFQSLFNNYDFRIIFVRPPYGDWDLAWNTFVIQNNLINVKWDVTTTQDLNYLFSILRNRGVLLLHTRSLDSQILSDIIDNLILIAAEKKGDILGLNSIIPNSEQ